MRIIMLVLAFSLCILSAIWACQLNYSTRAKEKQILEINKKIDLTSNRIRLLKAEWAFLNSPSRLSKLVDENFFSLNLVPISKKNLSYDLKSFKKLNEKFYDE